MTVSLPSWSTEVHPLPRVHVCTLTVGAVYVPSVNSVCPIATGIYVAYYS